MKIKGFMQKETKTLSRKGKDALSRCRFSKKGSFPVWSFRIVLIRSACLCRGQCFGRRMGAAGRILVFYAGTEYSFGK